MAGLARRQKVLIALMGLLILFGAQCGHEKPTGRSEAETGTILLQVSIADFPAVPELGAGRAKATITQGRLRIWGEGMSPRDTLLAVQAGRLRARIDGIPVGLRSVALVLQESISDTLWQASTEVTVVSGTPVTAVLALQRVGDSAPQVDFKATPELGGVRTEFVLQAQVSDRHDATDSLQVRWDFDNDGAFEVDWTLDKEVTHTFGIAGNFRIALEVRDRSGKTNSLTKLVQVVELLAQAGRAGPDTLAVRTTGGLVTLDGSASKGTQGQPLTYRWQVLDYPQRESVTVPGTFTDNNSTTASQVSFESKAGRGLYVFTLQVEDESTGIKSEPDTLYVNVLSEPPVADAGPDQTMEAGQTVQLDGGGSSDADGDVLSYVWTQTGGPTVTLQNQSAATPSFAPQEGGTYIFSLVVNDGQVNSAPDEVTVTITRPLLQDQANRIFELPKLSQPPVLDGVRSAAEWTSTLETECSPSQILRDGAAFGWRDIAGQVSAIGSANQLQQSAAEKASIARTDADASAHIWCAWDDEALYYIAEVRDNLHDVIGGGKMQNWWERDSISLYVDLTDTKEKGDLQGAYTALNIINFVAAAPESATPPIVWEYIVDSHRFASGPAPAPDAMQYSYRFALNEFGGSADYVLEGKIPWAVLMKFNLPAVPTAGTPMGFSWLLADPDGEEGYGGQLLCGGEPDDPSTYSTWVFTEH